MINRIGNLSREEGRSYSRLPVFTQEERDYIRGSSDFLGLNYYTSYMVEQTEEPVGSDPSMERDMGLRTFRDPDWPVAKSVWLYSVPEGIRGIMG